IDPKNTEAYTLLGQLYVAQHSVDKATQEFENELKVDPQSATAHTFLGMLYEMRSSRDQAQLHYREALKLFPESPIAGNNLAYLLAESGENLDEALRLARATNEKYPNVSSVMDTVGWVYYKKGAYASAVDSFKECVVKDPRHAACQYHLAMSFSKVGDS